MRVVAGLARGRKLLCAEGLGIRPTSDRAKEAIFSSLGDKLNGCCFLDLFSGSGAIGIEALSRGAQKVIFVEPEKIHIDVIKKNIEFVKRSIPGAKYRIIENTAAAAVELLSGEAFDIIFMDPPYNSSLWEDTLSLIHRASLLRENGVIIAEASKAEDIPHSEYFNIFKSKQYGKASVYYMEESGR